MNDTPAAAASAAPNFLNELWDGAKAAVSNMETSSVTEAKSLFSTAKGDASALFKAGLPIAVQAVIAEAPKVASGEEKFGSATASVAQLLEADFGPVAIKDAEAMVQLAYHWMPSLLADL
jgi:hypothetical protein